MSVGTLERFLFQGIQPGQHGMAKRKDKQGRLSCRSALAVENLDKDCTHVTKQ